MESCRSLVVPCLAAGAVLLAAGTVTAQPQEPFSGIPRAADVLVRVDMEALVNTPALAPIVQEMRAQSPNFHNFLFEVAAEQEPQLASVFGDFPGTARVYEIGVLMDSMGGGEENVFIAVTGDFDARALHQRLTSAEDWTQATTMGGAQLFRGPEGTDVVLTMPNAHTILMAPSEGIMGDMVATYAAAAPSAREGGLASMVNQHAGSPVFVAIQMPAEVKQMLRQTAASPPPEAQIVPGAPALIREAGALEAAVLTLGGRGNEALLGLALDMSNPEAAQRANSALNNMIPGLAMLGQMQFQQDPEMLAQIDQFKDLRFSQDGTGVSVQIPIPPDQLELFIAGLQDMAAGGMPGMMGGPPQGQMHFYD